ncbi:MAG TPA: FliM/FliN family flagellar motor C-terminal domain-containing protein, partial [Tepidisphaeraceae bacterium]|jgi:flagellar motor switch protein FliM
MTQLSAQSWFTYQRRAGHDDAAQKVTRTVSGAVVELKAILARTHIALSDLMALQPGDIITTERRTHEPVVVQIEGRHKFQASLGQFRGKKALRLLQVLPTAPPDAAAV